MTARPGLRVPGHWDTFELVVRTIFGERLVRPPSHESISAFVQAFGEPAPSPRDGLTHFFPTPERVRGADLSGVSITIRQSIAIRAYVGATPIGSFAPIEEVVDRLSALAGFDREMAAAIATRLAEPTDDVSGLAADDAAKIDACRPWRAYAALQLLGAATPTVDGGLLHAA